MSNIESRILQFPVTPSEEWNLAQLDLIYRALENAKISHAYYRLYCALIELWPDILTGEVIEDFQPARLRELAGKASKDCVTKFLRDMLAVGAILFYDPGQYDEDSHSRPGKIQGNPDVIPYPETFRLSETDQRKKERDAQRARNEARYLILNCQQCGSPDLSYQLLPVCKKCGFKHSPIGPIDVDRISLKEEEEDSFMSDMPTTEGETPSVHTEAMAPVKHPQEIEAVRVPRCQHWQCSTGPNKTQVRMWGGQTSFYCPVHGGYIDEQGRPL